MISFTPDHTSDVPVWVQLRERIIYLITSGELQPGDQLPTVRALAAEVSLNYNTVHKTYLSLQSDGYITSIRSKGAFVRDFDKELGDEHVQTVEKLLDDTIAACTTMGLSLDDTQKLFLRRISHAAQVSGVELESNPPIFPITIARIERPVKEA